MTVYSVQQIKYEFLLYMKGLGGAFGDWYVGAASDPEQALFEHHGVRSDMEPWIYKPALTNRATITIVRDFVEVLHADGRVPDIDDQGATIAFLFRKSVATRPPLATRREMELPMEVTAWAVGESGR
jgi:hypothetical protein